MPDLWTSSSGFWTSSFHKFYQKSEKITRKSELFSPHSERFSLRLLPRTPTSGFWTQQNRSSELQRQRFLPWFRSYFKERWRYFIHQRRYFTQRRRYFLWFLLDFIERWRFLHGERSSEPQMRHFLARFLPIKLTMHSINVGVFLKKKWTLWTMWTGRHCLAVRANPCVRPRRKALNNPRIARNFPNHQSSFFVLRFPFSVGCEAAV